MKPMDCMVARNKLPVNHKLVALIVICMWRALIMIFSNNFEYLKKNKLIGLTLQTHFETNGFFKQMLKKSVDLLRDVADYSGIFKKIIFFPLVSQLLNVKRLSPMQK